MSSLDHIDIDQPRWDQNTYVGRAKHFFSVTNPLNLLHSSKVLEDSKEIVQRHRAKLPQERPLTVDELYRAKSIYDSAFHPTTGEKTFILGRMSCQVPGNMLITGCMMTFYKSTPAVVFWQWVNQSFNALVNYCNRSGSDVPWGEMTKSYVIATSGAVGTALTLNRFARKAHPLIGRFVPFAAVAGANCINIPAMRSQELRDGISVVDDNNNELGKSKKAARDAIIAVVISRIVMASPGMIGTPILINSMERRGLFRNKAWLEPLVQVGVCGVFLALATPLACALFVQKVPVKVDKLESHIKEATDKIVPRPETLYYNKGL